MNKTGWQRLVRERFGTRCCEKAMMSLYCTYRVGGPAQMLVFPESAEEIRFLLELGGKEKIPLVVLGLGSNILPSDNGVGGLVCSLRGMRSLRVEGSVVTALAGTPLDDVVAAAVAAGLAGMEKLSGIPGSVGGAAWMNAGAFGQETFDKLRALEVMDANGAVKTFSKDELRPSYRKVDGLQGMVVLSATWRLEKGDVRELAAVRDSILRQRAEKQPLEYPSAGSVFKRPPGDYASRLIDACGLKGAAVGGAQVSPKHAGFIVNTGGASAADVYALIRKVIAEVEAKTGVRLELEQILLGEFGAP